MPEPIIVVKHLSKFFKTVKAVDDVSFEVSKGEIFGFLGPNGAGKTTTINMLTTLLKPTSGTATICGFDLVHQAGEVRRNVGVVPQEFTSDEEMTGYRNLLLCADLYGIPRRFSKSQAHELLQIVDLQDAETRKVSTYSGGMRRRLELACGLINYPRVLFMDEPTLGLDVQTRAAVWSYIKRFKEEYGMTLFLTTHYLEEADSLCDRIAIIDHGHLVRIGTPGELKASVGGDVVVIGVKEALPDVSADIARLPGILDVKKDEGAYRIKASHGDDAAPEVMDLLRSKGLHVSRLSISKPTLDEAYLDITGRRMREGGTDKMQMFSQRVTMKRARS